MSFFPAYYLLPFLYVTCNIVLFHLNWHFAYACHIIPTVPFISIDLSVFIASLPPVCLELDTE